jgi:hypothetical protein
LSNIGLLCTTHDPEGNNLALITKHHQSLSSIYNDIFITLSEESSGELLEELQGYGFNVKVIPKKGPAHARREVLKFGLESNNEFFQYCDFDRILTWCNNHSNELKRVVWHEISNCSYLILGRTERAICTHPTEWIVTERITNRIFSLELGKETDITAGSCAMSRSSAELIVQHSKQVTTDAEWAMIIHRIGKMKIDYLAVEGLEYDEEMNADIKHKSETEKWFARLKASYLISESSITTGKEQEESVTMES